MAIHAVRRKGAATSRPTTAPNTSMTRFVANCHAGRCDWLNVEERLSAHRKTADATRPNPPKPGQTWTWSPFAVPSSITSVELRRRRRHWPPTESRRRSSAWPSRGAGRESSAGQVRPVRIAPGLPDDPPHFVSELGLRVQHRPDGDGIFVGPDHDESSAVAPLDPLRTQPLAEHPTEGHQGENAGPGSDDGRAVATASIPAEQLESDGARPDGDNDPCRLLPTLHTEARSVQAEQLHGDQRHDRGRKHAHPTDGPSSWRAVRWCPRQPRAPPRRRHRRSGAALSPLLLSSGRREAASPVRREGPWLARGGSAPATSASRRLGEACQRLLDRSGPRVRPQVRRHECTYSRADISDCVNRSIRLVPLRSWTGMG